MSRLVRKDVTVGNSLFRLQASPVRANITTVAPAVQGAATETDTDDYTTRIVKYIPAGVVAFYLAADKLFAKGAELEHNPVDLNRKSIGWDSQSLIDRRVSSD